jgi:hypothetical protein
MKLPKELNLEGNRNIFKKKGSLYSHFLQEMFLFSISPHFYPVVLNFFANKLYYNFYYKKKRKKERIGI